MNSVKVIKEYGEVVKKLKQENIIRTGNVVGEIGEFYAINYFNKTKGLPKLQSTLVATKNVDAVSNRGERYTIKTSTSNSTGAFLGINIDDTEKVFEYALIVQLDRQYGLKSILQIDWKTFIKLRTWNNRLKAWKLNINKKLLNEADVIYTSK